MQFTVLSHIPGSAMTPSVYPTTALPGFAPTKQGKVRDIYDLGDTLLIAATDRLSAFDVVLPDGIPNKGKVLTQISEFWFRRLAGVVPNHVLSTDIADFPKPFKDHPEVFAGRSMLVRKTRPFAVECVVRGYISGSGWQSYKESSQICGIALPAGLKESDKLPQPLFTPSTKAEIGIHDENISFEEVRKTVGDAHAERLRDLTLKLYTEGASFALSRGIIIADTKFEFGLDDRGEIVWIDEALTPDSSRFWPVASYAAGGAQPSFDKQFVRDYLLSIKWNKKPPAPKLPENVVQTTSKKYEEALELLTGHGVM